MLLTVTCIAFTCSFAGAQSLTVDPNKGTNQRGDPTVQPKGTITVPAAMQTIWEVKIELATKQILADGSIKWNGWGAVVNTPVNNVPGGGGTVNWQQAGATSLVGAPAGLYVRATLRKKVGAANWIDAAATVNEAIP